MLNFTGIGQIQRRCRDYNKSSGNIVQLKYEIICSRGTEGVPYDGKSAFDVYPIIFRGTPQDKDRFECLKPGTIIWIHSGEIKTWLKRYQGNQLWNPYLMVPIRKVVVLGQTKLGPSYDDHVRLGSNERDRTI